MLLSAGHNLGLGLLEIVGFTSADSSLMSVESLFDGIGYVLVQLPVQ